MNSQIFHLFENYQNQIDMLSEKVLLLQQAIDQLQSVKIKELQNEASLNQRKKVDFEEGSEERALYHEWFKSTYPNSCINIPERPPSIEDWILKQGKERKSTDSQKKDLGKTLMAFANPDTGVVGRWGIAHKPKVSVRKRVSNAKKVVPKKGVKRK